MLSEEFNLLRNFRQLWLFCVRYGAQKLLTTKGNDSSYKLLSLISQVNFLCLPGSSHLDHVSNIVYSEYLLILMVASKYGAQDLDLLRIRCKTLGQASILLPIDNESLQQLNKMHGQSMGKIFLSQYNDFARDHVLPPLAQSWFRKIT